MYIVPQYDNITIWHGVIFIREGLYKDGIFKFEIKIPNEFPNEPPVVQFFTQVYHPLINKETNILDLSKKFPVWDARNNVLIKVIYYIQDVFYNPIYLKLSSTDEEEITQEMMDEISKSVKTSIANRFVNPPKSSIKFSEHTKYHKLILDKILKQNKEISTYDRIEDFKNWFMNNFMEILQNNESQKKSK